MAVMDSLTQRFSSSKWPITKHKQRTATNNVKGTTGAWSLPMFLTVSSTPISLSSLQISRNTVFPELREILPRNGAEFVRETWTDTWE